MEAVVNGLAATTPKLHFLSLRTLCISDCQTLFSPYSLCLLSFFLLFVNLKFVINYLVPIILLNRRLRPRFLAPTPPDSWGFPAPLTTVGHRLRVQPYLARWFPLPASTGGFSLPEICLRIRKERKVLKLHSHNLITTLSCHGTLTPQLKDICCRL